MRGQSITRTVGGDMTPRIVAKRAALRRHKRCRKTCMRTVCFMFAMTLVLPHYTPYILLRYRTPTSGSRCCEPKGVQNIAIVMYGLPRSLAYTLESILENIIAPLHAAGFQTCIYAHTYIHRSRVTNKRSGEDNKLLNNREIDMLGACRQTAESLMTVQQTHLNLLGQLKKYDSVWKDNLTSVTRYLLALHSLSIATDLAMTSGTPYAGMAIIRPDLKYHDPVDVQLFKRAIDSNTIVVPRWQSWEKGLNDRFCYGAVQPMSRLGNRIYWALEYAQQDGKFHAERFMLWATLRVLSYGDSELLCTNQRASRIRAGGKPKKENFKRHLSPECSDATEYR